MVRSMELLKERPRAILLAFALTSALAAAYFVVAAHAPSLLGREVPVRIAEGSAPWEFGDERKLAFVSTNIFIGRVVEQVGGQDIPSDGGESWPRTQFSVQVLQNIKGQLAGTVIVDQDGGYYRTAQGVELILIDGDPLLEPGQTYLFAVEPSTLNESWYAIAGEGYGDVPIRDAQQRQALVEKWQKAKANQVNPFLTDGG